ncbi:MAG TPA: SDR family NAD(P)-dependent oxidoreductase, partial [Dehalococcoidia bacterium]|nr:SDR family NAD(P)-dependent oxidoreductase [Dehalococcoidia bacterium]
MYLELEGKKALVTGGSRGIGKAIARELITSGCDVAIFARNLETLELTARELSQETGRQVVGIPTDVISTEAVEQSVKEAAQALDGQVHILVNNAAAPGGLARGSLESIKDEDV